MGVLAKKNEVKSIKGIKNDLLGLNSLAKKVLSLASNSTQSTRDIERQQLRSDIDNIIKNDLKEMSDLEGRDLTTLLARYVTTNTRSRIDSEKMNKFDVEDIFENESNGLIGHFQERYRNVNLQLEDLQIITKQIHELKEAINVTRDAILSSDDMTATISRTISFTKENIADDDTDSYMKIIEDIEEEHDLAQKLKNHIVPNTLIYGRYYVYTVPYEEIFSKHMYKKLNDNNTKVMRESFTGEELVSILENYNIDDKDTKKQAESYLDTANDILNSVSVENDIVPLPLLESGMESLFVDLGDNKELTKVAQSAVKDKKSKTVNDGVIDINEVKEKDLDFSEFTGCHVELIDPRKMIPLKILNKTIGYYYIHEETSKKVRSPFTTNFHVDSTLNAKDVETNFVLSLTEKIVKDFDKKFLEKNVQFKETIMNALIYHDVYKKDIRFQFIPARYITEFSVNQDDKGEGTSILIDALFYAKLYLALLIFKMISIIARSNDQRLYYVKTSGMSNDVTNQVQDIVRQMKQREINFTDLLNYKSIVTKVGAAKDIFMPVGPEDIKGIDFDTMAGQDIQLNSELMESLKTSAINATSVPSVMMQYINEADYARTLEMANSKFLGRAVSLQIDINRGATELYRKILMYSSTEIPREVISTLIYKLSTPSALSSTNLANLINEVQTSIDFIIKARMGDNAQPTELENVVRDVMFRRLAKQRIGSIRWDAIEGMMDDIYIEATEILKQKKAQQENENV